MIIVLDLKDAHNTSKPVCIKPLSTRLEAIQKLKLPKRAKYCKSYVGVLNYLSIFYPNL